VRTARSRRATAISSTRARESQKHQSLLALVQGRDDVGGVAQRSNEVDADIDRAAVRRRRRGDDDAGPVRPICQPVEQRGGIADSGGQTKALDRARGQPGQSRQHAEQVPATVPGGEGVHLVDHDGLQISEEPCVLDPGGDQHALQGLWRSQQEVGRLRRDPALLRLRNVAVRHRRSTAEPAGHSGQPRFQVVEQGLERTDVEDRESAPTPRLHPRQQRQDGGLGLAAGGRREQQRIRAVEHGLDGRFLQPAQTGPAEVVDAVEARVAHAEHPENEVPNGLPARAGGYPRCGPGCCRCRRPPAGRSAAGWRRRR
jgi:hypothetical protein